jgi:hypothetical protein
MPIARGFPNASIRIKSGSHPLLIQFSLSFFDRFRPVLGHLPRRLLLGTCSPAAAMFVRLLLLGCRCRSCGPVLAVLLTKHSFVSPMAAIRPADGYDSRNGRRCHAATIWNRGKQQRWQHRHQRWHGSTFRHGQWHRQWRTCRRQRIRYVLGPRCCREYFEEEPIVLFAHRSVLLPPFP